jgi:hypothetical protein
MASAVVAVGFDRSDGPPRPGGIVRGGTMTTVWLGASCRAGGVVADGGASISAGALSANPSALSFGDVPLGRTASQNVRLTNTGAGTVTITQLDVTGSGFTGSGLAVPVTLAPGESRSVAVAFAPRRWATSPAKYPWRPIPPAPQSSSH